MIQYLMKTTFILIFAMLALTVSGQITVIKAQPKSKFEKSVEAKLKNTPYKLSTICPIDTDAVAKRIFADYGAIFISPVVKLPGKCVLDSPAEAERFQVNANPQTDTIGGVQITLQQPAMEALKEARAEAQKAGLSITPRGGSSAAARSYDDTVTFWNSRLLPGLAYWVKQRRITAAEAAEVKRAAVREQVERVLAWEKDGIYFSKDLSKSILYSVAAPGASQHIFMVALDVTQFGDAKVREILARHGWYQTVASDLPHFTYLGVIDEDPQAREAKLAALGLKKKTIGGQDFWIPDMDVEEKNIK